MRPSPLCSWWGQGLRSSGNGGLICRISWCIAGHIWEACTNILSKESQRVWEKTVGVLQRRLVKRLARGVELAPRGYPASHACSSVHFSTIYDFHNWLLDMTWRYVDALLICILMFPNINLRMLPKNLCYFMHLPFGFRSFKVIDHNDQTFSTVGINIRFPFLVVPTAKELHQMLTDGSCRHSFHWRWLAEPKVTVMEV